MRTSNILVVLISLLGGILLARLGIDVFFCILLAVLSIFAFFTSSLLKNPLAQSRSTICTLAGTYFLFLSIGILTEYISLPPRLPLRAQRYEIKGYVEDIIQSTAGDKLLTDISTIKISGSREIIRPGSLKALIISSDVSVFRRGDIITGNLQLSHIEMPGNFINNNYVTFLKNKNIYLQGFADSEELKIAAHTRSIKSWGKDIRDDLEIFIENTHLKNATKDFLISLLLGDRQFLSNETKTIFADAGISHILALSGLHVTIVSLVILYLLSFLSCFGNHKLKFVFAIPAVWIYIVITGFSPSTIRAGAMLTLFFTAIILERKYAPLNSLLWTVILILCFSPNSLFDIGFQLSVISVAGIIMIVPKLSEIKIGQKYLDKIISLVIVSLVATFSTWTISSFYFEKISLLFLPANLMTVPLLPFYIGFSIIYISAYVFGINIVPIGYIIDTGYKLLMDLTQYIASLGGVINNFSVGKETVFLWIIAIVALSLYLSNRKKQRILLPTAFFILTIVSIPIFAKDTSKNGFIVQTFYPKVNIVHYTGEELQTFVAPENVVSSFELNGNSLICINGRISDTISRLEKVGKIDYIILAGGFKENPEILKSIISEDTKIIIHNSIRKKREKELTEYFYRSGVDFHSLRHAGPFHCF